MFSLSQLSNAILNILNEGMPFKRDDDETAAEFCDEYCYEFNEMNKISGSIDLKMNSLSKLYHPNGEMNIIGYKKFAGRESIIQCLYVSSQWLAWLT